MTEKKKKGRPIAGEKPKDRMLRIRIDEDIKAKLEAQKKRTGKTMSQIVIELIEQLDD
ncbi:ribbon-helix-helix protein, CopG family [Lactococcus ileimucosae]|uniref:Ribbon-helix-helix protein, CopG family n=1 Tax=Lactococcus ileimucosae TaxID=2941329 RepID=A0ABV4D2V5_9LACT|nr:ribbon-helix-helix protein, CopG family [Lactococcus lactis]